MKTVVVGGGIAGLSAAYRLIESNRNGLEVTLLESSDRFGGTIRTIEHGGCLVELGPDSFLSSKPWLKNLAERLGVADQIIPTSRTHRRSHVVYQGKLHRLPEGFLMMAPTCFWPMLTSSLFSFAGKARCAFDLILPRRAISGEESIGSFVRRRFGREVLDRVVQPLIGGIYAGDPDTLSLRATMPRFLEMETQHRSVIKAMVAQRRAAFKSGGNSPNESGARYGELVSFERGMESIVHALNSNLPPETLHTHSKVVNLNREDNRWHLTCSDGKRFDADNVILALPARKAAGLIRSTDPGLHDLLSAIPYTSSSVINLVYKRSEVPHPLDCFGFVVPAVEKRPIIACTFSSVKFPNRTPDGLVLLRTFVGGTLQKDMLNVDDDEMMRIVQGELKTLLGIEAPPQYTVLTRYPNAMPQYLVGHIQRIEQIRDRIQHHPGLALAGNTYHGVGLPDCVYSGEQAADHILTINPAY